MISYIVDTIASSRIYFRFCWSPHLPAYCYIFFMLFKHLCLKESLLLNDWSIPIVFILSSRRGDCNIPLITTHCFLYVSIERIESMALFIIRDLTYWAVYDDFLFIWKHKYSLPAGGNFYVVCNSIGAIEIVTSNRVKWVVVDVAWTLCFGFRGVTHEWMSSVFEVLLLFWFLVLSLLSSWDEIDVRVKLIADDVWEYEDDKTGFLRVGINIFWSIVFAKTTNSLAH